MMASGFHSTVGRSQTPTEGNILKRTGTKFALNTNYTIQLKQRSTSTILFSAQLLVLQRIEHRSRKVSKRTRESPGLHDYAW